MFSKKVIISGQIMEPGVSAGIFLAVVQSLAEICDSRRKPVQRKCAVNPYHSHRKADRCFDSIK
jgi:hypothetical protein